MQLDDDYARRYMLPGERLLFGEKLVSRSVFQATMVLCGVLGLIGLAATAVGLFGPPGSTAALGLGIPFIATSAILAPLSVLFSVIRSMITTSHLQVHFGWAKRKVPFDAIQKIAIVPYVGAKQGKVSMGFDGVVRTWVGTPSSGRGVEVTYQDDKRKHVLTIGSDDAARFAEALQQARATATGVVESASGGRSRARIAAQGGSEDDAEREADEALEARAPADEEARAERGAR
jgi:hypothetical protein